MTRTRTDRRETAPRLAGIAIIAALVALTSTARLADAQESVHLSFVAEGGTKTRYSADDAMFHLRASRGWIRSPVVFDDFTLSFDVRATAEHVDAGVVVRAAYDRQQLRGYRLALPDPARPDRAKWLTASPDAVTTVEEHAVPPAAAGAWQHMTVSSIGRRVSVMIDGALAGAYDVEQYAGLLLFVADKGSADLRNLRMTTVAPPAPDPPVAALSAKDLEKAGGRSPRLVHEVKPYYTPEAMRAKIQGRVELEAIVLVDGTVTGVRVTRGLDPNLDRIAAGVLRQWRFTPAYVDGRPVPTIIQVELTFTLK